MNFRVSRLLAALSLLAAALPSAMAEVAPLHPIVVAVRNGDCQDAVARINHAVEAGDGESLFWGARMLYEGICVEADRDMAARYFRRSAELGVAAARVEHATDLGLGREASQSYEEAAIGCREGGATTDTTHSTYTVGYACTVGGLAGRLLRHTLPPEALRGPKEALRVEFTPASGEIRIIDQPKVALELNPALGTRRRRPLVDLPQAVADAWSKALQAAPKPDPARLDPAPLTLVIDVDLDLESGVLAVDRKAAFQGLLQLPVADIRFGPGK